MVIYSLYAIKPMLSCIKCTINIYLALESWKRNIVRDTGNMIVKPIQALDLQITTDYFVFNINEVEFSFSSSFLFLLMSTPEAFY